LNLFGAWNLVLGIYLRRNVAADPWSAIKVKSEKLKTQPRLAELGGVTDEK